MDQGQLFKIRDKRKEGRYFTDNEFIDGYAKKVGWQGQCVYGALCRHARDSKCYPGQKHLAVELVIGLTSVKIGIRKLLEFDIIAILKRNSRQGRASNEYWLLDKSEWKSVSGWSNQPKDIRELVKKVKIKP